MQNKQILTMSTEMYSEYDALWRMRIAEPLNCKWKVKGLSVCKLEYINNLTARLNAGME